MKNYVTKVKTKLGGKTKQRLSQINKLQITKIMYFTRLHVKLNEHTSENLNQN